MPTLSAPPFALIEANHRLASTFYARGGPLASVTELPGALAIYCGQDAMSFNIASLSAPAPSLASIIPAVAAHYDGLRTGSALWICEDLVSRFNPFSFGAHGYSLQQRVPGMLARGFAPPRRALPAGLTIHPIATERDATDFAYLVSVVFHVPFSTCQRIYGPAAVWREPIYGFLGRLHGEAVSCAMVAAADQVAGFYSVATHPQHQGRGYAESLMRYAADWAARSLHCPTAVLQSSPAGRKLYKRLGFEEHTHFAIFNRRGAAG